MTAASANRRTPRINESAPTSYKMAASTTIYAGTMVMLNSAGLAVPASALSGNQGVVGVAQRKVVSDSSTTAYVPVTEGIFLFAGTTLADTSLGLICYAEDDQTIDESSGTNQPIAGRIYKVASASKGWVKIGLTEAGGAVEAV